MRPSLTTQTCTDTVPIEFQIYVISVYDTVRRTDTADADSAFPLILIAISTAFSSIPLCASFNALCFRL